MSLLPLRIPRSAWRSPLRSAIKAWSVLVGDGMLLSARPEIAELDLERDFAGIERLLAIEEWPFVRADLEASAAQPRAVGYVARARGDDGVAGFYTAHDFGDVGYLDMSIVAPEHRRRGIGRPLHARAMREMKRRGLRAFVVHTTRDSAPLIWILGFDAGQTFTLLAACPRIHEQAAYADPTPCQPTLAPSARPLARDPAATPMPTTTATVAPPEALGPADLDALVALDAEVFGVPRAPWIAALLGQPTTRFFGVRDGASLGASVCVRARHNGAVCLDGANARRFADLAPLLTTVIAAHAGRRVECFVRDGGALDRFLRAAGFTVPPFFEAIGPLTEWRKGKTGAAGRTPLVECLSWF